MLFFYSLFIVTFLFECLHAFTLGKDLMKKCAIVDEGKNGTLSTG